MKNIKHQTIEQIGLLQNNRLEAVLIPTEEYGRLKALGNIEYAEIHRTVEARCKTPKSEYVSLEVMAEEFDIDLNTL